MTARFSFAWEPVGTGIEMRLDYRLYELSNDEFETFVVLVCTGWLGAGVIPFATGRDGGRDGKFHGTAQSFPSTTSPLNGHFVLQAKHVSAPDRSCSDRDFASLLKKEHPRIKRLVSEGICDHYLVFTNRKLTGGADEKLIKALKAQGPSTAHVVGTERLHLALDEHEHIRNTLPNCKDVTPFRFEPDDIVEVIGALHAFAEDGDAASFDSARDFEAIKVRTQKNKINGLSEAYYRDMIVNGSMLHFERIEQFLKNPRNRQYADLYHDAADELKQKIFSKRDQFDTFDDVFPFLYEQIQSKRDALRGRRRLISVLLHYMYCNCDIGSKEMAADGEARQC